MAVKCAHRRSPRVCAQMCSRPIQPALHPAPRANIQTRSLAGSLDAAPDPLLAAVLLRRHVPKTLHTLARTATARPVSAALFHEIVQTASPPPRLGWHFLCVVLGAGPGFMAKVVVGHSSRSGPGSTVARHASGCHKAITADGPQDPGSSLLAFRGVTGFPRISLLRIPAPQAPNGSAGLLRQVSRFSCSRNKKFFRGWRSSKRIFARQNHIA